MGTMVRLIDGILFEGHPTDEFELTVHRLGNGHVESNVQRMVAWSELRRANRDELEVWRRDLAESEEERRQLNRKRAARRATTRVRRLCKVAGFDSLLTLTYRASQSDLAVCKKHLKEFVRRMRRLIPGWQYVAAFELQQRGSWHVHLAIYKLPMSLPAANAVKVKSYNVVRAVWRSVVGLDNGNIDESRRRRNSGRSSAKVASYISKYMLKAFVDGDEWSNRYSAGGLGALPLAQRTKFRSRCLAELIQRAYDEAHTGACDCWTSLRKFADVVEGFFISTGPPPPGRLRLELSYG